MELLKEGDEKESDLEAKYLENAKFFAHLEVHWTWKNEKALRFQVK